MDGNQVKCSKCGSPLPASSSFCTNCGTAVNSGSTGTFSASPVTPSSSAPAGSTPTTSAPVSSTPAAPAATGTAMGSTTPVAPTAPSAPEAPKAPVSPSASPYSTPAPGAQPTGGVTAPGSMGTPTGTTAPMGTPAGTTAPMGTPGQSRPAYGQQPAQPGQPYSQASAYGTPGAPGTMPGGQRPGQPAQPYGQQPAQPGQPYSQSPAYGSPGVPGTPGAPGAMPGAQPPKKKKSPVGIIVVVVLLLVAIGVVAVILIGQNATKTEYADILTEVTGASSPSSVASKGRKLHTFMEDNPNFDVDKDLLELIEICEEYVDADDSEARYINAIEDLSSLESSDIDAVADCASDMVDYVEEDYVDYLASIAPPPEPSTDENGGGDDSSSGGGGSAGGNYATECPLVILGEATIFEEDGGQYYTFASQNTSSKGIEYSEFWAFAFNAQGELLKVTTTGLDAQWCTNDKPYSPGQTITVNEFGYYEFKLDEPAAYVYIAVNYIEFTDGSEWGTYSASVHMMPSDTEAYFNHVRDTLAIPAAQQALASSSVVFMDAILPERSIFVA